VRRKSHVNVIARTVLANADRYRAAFQSARPFKHLCIDGFLEPEMAERALADFPAFDKKLAIDEYGRVGRKAVNSRLADISPFYRDVYRYLFSDEFLAAMSALTGIPDLIGDPSMYGGGTHENLHGQELDPHVDFNYVAGGGAHRRVNMLIYLNKAWDSSWGGDIEIHSNPRDPENNSITSYRVDFNRAVIFETNEYSWHGFGRIVLPPEQRDKISRKCLSIYLYTRERPAAEIAGTHATFYVQRPLGRHLVPGHVLTGADLDELQHAVRKRDQYIEAYQKQEELAGRRQAALEGLVNDLLANARLPVVGYAFQLRKLEGRIWPDGWVGKSLRFEMRAERRLTSVVLRADVPESAPAQERRFRIAAGAAHAREAVVTARGPFALSLPLDIAAGEVFEFSLACDSDFSPASGGSGDERMLSYTIGSCTFE